MRGSGKIRELRPGDLAELTHLCNVALEHDRFTEALVSEKTVGSPMFDRELGLAEISPDGRLAGFVCGIRGERGGKPWVWIQLMAVHPAFRKRGIGSKLLNEFETRAKAGGARRISVMDSPNYYMPGVDPMYTEATCFLAKHGYTKGHTNENLICDLWPERFDCRERIEALAVEGFEIRRAGPADRDGIDAFLSANFPEWKGEVFIALENNPPIVHICVHRGEVVAFAASEGNNKGTGWFGPMGTTPATRGKGIGAINLQLCLNDLADLGFRHAIIPWVGPVRFYARFCGARRHRVFWTYEKEL